MVNNGGHMPEAKLILGEGARAARAALAVYSAAGTVEVMALAPGLALPAAGAVLVVTLAEARALRAVPPAGAFALVLWLRPGEQAEAALLCDPAIAGALRADSPPETIYTVMQSAFRLLAAPAEASAARMLEKLLEIGRALAAEKDLDTLLSLILTHARGLTGADGASIYTRDVQGRASVAGGRMPGATDKDGELYFRLWQNASNPAAASAEKTRVGADSIAGYVARSGASVLLDDAYAIPESAPYRFNPASDRAIGYRTRSLLTLPLTDKGGAVVGVLQLINRKHRPEARLRTPEDVATQVRPFDARSRQLALALAGLAGVALENSLLYADIERLFEGFIRASVAAIEARDPTTAGHSFRVAGFTERLAQAVDRSDAPAWRDLRFTRDELREIRYAALLHDFGKVGVREDVLVKAKKLHPHQLELLRQRFKYARLSVAWQAYRRLLDGCERDALGAGELRARRASLERELAAEHARLERYLHAVLRANEPNVLHAHAPDELREIQSYTFADDAGAVPLLHEFEFGELSLPKGSLSAEERVEIESHVSHTYAFLSLIPWTRDLARLPEFAYAHHEKLDGSGYPRGLQQADIPLQTRILTISDIYDALTAPDRPYKLAVPAERALAILAAEAEARKIDAALLEVFVDSGAWRGAS
jgi:HD-GYP domain-containing protein (c-di-GMP phosphodiesterase class II)